jgi:hypothetical protein
VSLCTHFTLLNLYCWSLNPNLASDDKSYFHFEMPMPAPAWDIYCLVSFLFIYTVWILHSYFLLIDLFLDSCIIYFDFSITFYFSLLIIHVFALFVILDLLSFLFTVLIFIYSIIIFIPLFFHFYLYYYVFKYLLFFIFHLYICYLVFFPSWALLHSIHFSSISLTIWLAATRPL